MHRSELAPALRPLAEVPLPRLGILGGGQLAKMTTAAAMRLSLPDANPTLYLTSALVITFPFNVTLGIPIYYAIAKWWMGGN
ncbi:MAG: sodium-dependent bicarbonate transport family permease [Elusimicrobia bacterium]|nr:sodium-dependent bicarbonate transport family permease [Elusimicrobiota bacterium]